MPPFFDEGALISIGPDRLLVGIGPFEEARERHPDQLAFFISDFFLEDENPWRHPARWEEISIALPSPFIPLPHGACLPDRQGEGRVRGLHIDWSSPSRVSFEMAFAELMRLIEKGSLKKGVLLAFERGSQNCPPQAFLQHLLSRVQPQSGLFFYAYWKGNRGIFGATPEILFERADRSSLMTMALAGTTGSGDPRRLDDAKERREHQLVIDYLREQLSPHGTMSFGEREAAAAHRLHHLKTVLHVNLQRKWSMDELVRLLHPTPALGSSPLDMAWLKRGNEAADRGRFGAPFGVEFPDGRALCLVAIRNVAWEGEELCIGSGCGVVQGSELEREWQELALKRQSVKELFGL